MAIVTSAQIKKIRNIIKKMKKKLPQGTSFQAAFEQEISNDAFTQSDENKKKTTEVIYKCLKPAAPQELLTQTKRVDYIIVRVEGTNT